jgi:hypothetical protein
VEALLAIVAGMFVHRLRVTSVIGWSSTNILDRRVDVQLESAVLAGTEHQQEWYREG